MVYKIIVITEPIKTPKEIRQVISDVEAIIEFAKGKLFAYSEDGPQEFKAKLKNCSKGHRFTFGVDHLTEANLSRLMRALNNTYLTASAARM